MNSELKMIKKIIKKYDNIIITGHKNPDYDSVAAALGMYEICKKMKKDTCIYLPLDKINISLTKTIKIIEDFEKKYALVDENNIKTKINSKTLLIIVDTSSRELIECQELLNLDCIVIDHHVESDKKIPTIYEKIDESSSSVSEMVTYLLDKFNIKLDAYLSTLLLVGIEVDTNSYMIKTTSKTYIASSMLMKYADNKIKAQILKETREEFLKKANMIKRSYMLDDNKMICILNNEIFNQKDLAQVADELLQMEDVEASFVIGKIDKKVVSLSARSLGKIDVEKITKSLGGGGTTTSAGAQFIDVSLKQVKDKLTNLIKR